MEVRFLKLQEVIHLTTLSKATIYEKMDRGEFPRQMRLGLKGVAWLSTDIYLWMNKITNSRLLSDEQLALILAQNQALHTNSTKPC